MSKPTEFRQATLDGAGKALRELVKHGNALEAQVSISLVLLYLSEVYEIENEALVHTLLHNMEQVRGDVSLKTRVMESIHNTATRDHAKAPRTDEDPRILTSHKVGDLKRHGQLPKGGVLETKGKGVH